MTLDKAYRMTVDGLRNLGWKDLALDSEKRGINASFESPKDIWEILLSFSVEGEYEINSRSSWKIQNETSDIVQHLVQKINLSDSEHEFRMDDNGKFEVKTSAIIPDKNKFMDREIGIIAQDTYNKIKNLVNSDTADLFVNEIDYTIPSNFKENGDIVENQMKRVIHTDMVSGETTETIEEIVDASPAVKTGITPVIEIQKVYNSLKRKSERLTAIGTKKSRAEKVQVDSQLKEVESRLLNAQKKFVNDQLDLRLAQVDKNIDVMEDMSLEGTLTDKIIHQLFYSTTRPIVGGFGGYASSAFFTDGTGTNDDAITLGFVLAGAGLGNWSKVLREGEKSKYAISTFDRENLKMVVDAEQNLLTKRFINMAVSGSLSSRLETTGGWAKITGNLLFDTIGNATDSVESKVNRGNRAFMNQLATTLGDYSVDTFLSQKGNQSLRKVVGEVVNNFVDVNDCLAPR